MSCLWINDWAVKNKLHIRRDPVFTDHDQDIASHPADDDDKDEELGSTRTPTTTLPPLEYFSITFMLERSTFLLCSYVRVLSNTPENVCLLCRDLTSPSIATAIFPGNSRIARDTEKTAVVMEGEVRSLHSKQTFSGVFGNTLTYEQGRKVLRSNMNVIEKFLPPPDNTGNRAIDKVKARLCVDSREGKGRAKVEAKEATAIKKKLKTSTA